MESFSLLKYWRGGGGVGGNASVNPRSTTASGGTTTIVTAVTTTHQPVDTDDDDDDDGPFFDLEFAVPDEDETEENEDEKCDDQNDGVSAKSDGDGDGDETEFNFTLSSGSSSNPSDLSLTLSPSDDLFFKGKLVPIETGSSLESKATQFPVSLIKSATKFRVFLLKLKNSKLNSVEKTESGAANEPVSAPKLEENKDDDNNNNNNNKKLLTVKFKVEEVPIMSLFSRDNNKSVKQVQQSSEEDTVSDEKKFTKDVMQKYLNKVKPLYVKVSRKYGDKLKFSGQMNLGSLKPSTPTSTAADKGQVEVDVGKNMKQMNIQAGLRVVCKHLGKSRSASSAAVAAASSAAVAAAPPPASTVSKRRDDSLLQQEDGIQGAILHCKRSFNGSQESSEVSVFPRSVSDPSHEKSINLRKSSPDEAKA